VRFTGNPPEPTEAARAAVSELRAELAHGVNFTRTLASLSEADLKTLRKVARKAREARGPGPQTEEELIAATFGRHGRL
jgi:hypothetical protein